MEHFENSYMKLIYILVLVRTSPHETLILKTVCPTRGGCRENSFAIPISSWIRNHERVCPWANFQEFILSISVFSLFLAKMRKDSFLPSFLQVVTSHYEE